MNKGRLSDCAIQGLNGGYVGDSGPIHLRQEIGPCMYLRSELQISEGISARITVLFSCSISIFSAYRSK